MDVSSLKGKMPNEILESVLERGMTRLAPPQEAAIEKGLLKGNSMIIAAPTASGKTLIAEIACANAIIAKGKKAVYIAPMRALVTEKFNDFKNAYPYIKCAMSIGDLDSGDSWLQSYDMLFASTEKFDSLMRHGISWLGSVGCIVYDEVHMLGDSSRGPTLEVLMTKLKRICNAQIIGLSATIGNAKDIAKWLGAELVESDYRPVKLKRGIVHEGRAYYANFDAGRIEEEELGGSAALQEARVLEDTLERSKQLLVFYATKRNAESGAVKLAAITEMSLTAEQKVKLGELGNAIENVLDRPTEQCIKLSKLIKRGIAFHHAGLLNAQRGAIEEAFKANLIKAICSTTTLGLGVNLPAHTVIVRDISRYEGGANEMMGINEVLQLFGRAGRPKYDKEGRALLIAHYKDRIMELYNAYIRAEPEPIDSNLGIVPVLRTHILSFIAENFLNDKKRICEFLGGTFYGFQYGNSRHIDNVVDEILVDLSEYGFVSELGRNEYMATKVGKRVSELYIDPLSAHWIIEALGKKSDALGMLYMITNTLEMRPYVRRTDEAEEAFVMYSRLFKDKRLINEFERVDYGYYDPVRAFATAMMLNDWIDERKEPDIIKKYKTTPGELYSKLMNADWISYSALELAKLVHAPQHDLVNLRVRLRYGIKDELLDLVRLQQIGRARARMLYANGIKTVADLRVMKIQAEKLLGKDISKKVFEQLD